MIEFGFLLSALLLLYLAECAVWVPAGSIAFRLSSNPKRPLRIITKSRVVPRSSIVFAYPFFPPNDVVVCSPQLLSICPEGIAPDPRFLAGARGGFVAFEKIFRIGVELRKLVVNGAPFVATSSEIQATELADFLKRLRKRTSKERTSEIEKQLARNLDSDGAQSRLEDYAETTSTLSRDSLTLQFMVFVVSPVVVWKFGLNIVWPFLLIYLVLHVSLIAWDFHRASRRLFPTAGTARWGTIAMILLSPPAALRATKYLARDIGLGYHPLAFAASRCSNKEFRKLASSVLREVMFAPEAMGLDKQSVDCSQWFRHRFQNAVLELLRKHGNALQELIAPPLRESEHVQSYCPRCLAQFVLLDGVCTDCDSVPLRSYNASKNLPTTPQY
jgi:hypothetical protein